VTKTGHSCLHTPVLTGMRNKRNLGKTRGVGRNKKDIAIIHIGLYHLEREYLILLCPFNSYTFRVDLMTKLRKMIFK
jgi:hypothetical protein